MKNAKIRLVLIISILSSAHLAHAQGSGELTTAFIVGFAVLVLVLLVAAVTFIADNLMQIEAKNMGINNQGANFSVFPKLSELFGEKPEYLDGNQPVTLLKEGYDIPLAGAPAPALASIKVSGTHSLSPKDFVGMSPIPKILFAEGEEVKAGDTLFFDKKRPEIKYASPVSGEVVSITRGEKRSINEIVILADKEISYKEIKEFDLKDCTRESLIEYLLENGVWPFIRQRPFDIVADPKDTPKSIFISTFDSAPLAPDLNFAMEGQGKNFQKGLDILGKLTEGKIHLGLNASMENKPSSVFLDAKGVQKNWFKGPHPSGNVGIQIHHTDPIAKGDVVWVMNAQDVNILGRLFNDKKYDTERLVAVSGAELIEPKYIKAKQGANIESMVKDNLANDQIRIVSGDVLTGKKVEQTGHLGFFDDQVTVLKENNNYEMFGWLIGMTPRPTISKSYPQGLYKGLKMNAETNTHGEHRAFVVTGQYESVLPMDIYPQHLFKSIIVNDFERMEGLGIYELAPEDVALCEFACTSKQDLQSLLAQGLETIREQG